MKVSWLYLLNVLLLQWFFIRLTKCIDNEIVEMNMTSISLMPDGGMSAGGTVKRQKVMWWAIQYWIIPLTGWRSNFIFVGKGPRFKKVSSKRKL